MSILLQTLVATGGRMTFDSFPAGGAETGNTAAGTQDADDGTKDAYAVTSGNVDQYTDFIVTYDMTPLDLPAGSTIDFVRGKVRARGGTSAGAGNVLNDASIYINSRSYISGDGGHTPASGSTALDGDASVWTNLSIDATDADEGWNGLLVGNPDLFARCGLYVTVYKTGLTPPTDFTLETSEFSVEIW